MISFIEKLEMLSTVDQRSGITAAEQADIRNLLATCGGHDPLGILSDKQLENINVMYSRFFD